MKAGTLMMNIMLSDYFVRKQKKFIKITNFFEFCPAGVVNYIRHAAWL